MRKLLLAAALFVLVAPSRLHAQPAPDDQLLRLPAHGPSGGPGARGARHGGEHRGEHGPRLFISPSGEPFRGENGLAAWFGQADADHDGAITPAEFQADATRAFKLYDANGDGVVDGFEIQAYERQRVPEISEITFGGEDRGDGRRGRQGAARFSLLNEPEPLLAADEDVDGRVTLAEWMRATARRFATLDKTHAGRLTLAGLEPARPKR